MNKKYQIFISSTFTDLREERAKVRDAILSMQHFPVGMEIFGAANESQWKIIKDTIDSSDYYVLIIAYRYGSVITEGEDTGKSYTEKEYRYAVSQGIPVLAFLIDDSVKVDPKNVELEHRDELKRFKELIANKHLYVKWQNPDDLAQKVATSLHNEFERGKRIGWIRGDDTCLRENEELKNKVSILEKEVDRLKSENAALSAKRLPKLELYFKPDTLADSDHPELYCRADNFTKDKDDIYHLKMEKVPTGMIEAEYMPISRKTLGTLESYITDEEITKYNDSLPSQAELKKYIADYTVYQRVKNHGIAIALAICNEGKAKATDITVDLEFPKDILLIDINKVEECIEPKALPKPRDLMQVAIERRKEERNSYIKHLGLKNRNLAQPIALPSHDWMNLNIPKYYFDFNDEVIFLDDNSVRIKPKDGIVHTKSDYFSGLYVVPLVPGNYQVKATIMCAEYETFIEKIIDFVCE